MKKTFTTIMPDHIGAFLKADKCISGLGLNITRVSYNKAVDVHMLFIEVEGNEEQLRLADKELSELGYLNSQPGFGDVILMEFRLKDEPGALLPVLELINQYRFNISYISSQENGTDYQYFKMGLFVDNGREVSEFVTKAAMLCSIRIVDYNKSEKVLDNTVFYLSFANDISEKMGFNEEEKSQLIVNSNLVMQLLDEHGSPPYKTFDYIARFADFLLNHRGDGFDARISRHKTVGGVDILLIEPPCGSNVCVIFTEDRCLFVDSGFACCKNDLERILEKEIDGFSDVKKELMLTHADVDHSGCVDMFDKVYLTQKCLDNFVNEKSGGDALREKNPLHAPYVRISKLLSDYYPPETDSFEVVGGTSEENDELLKKIGTLSVGSLNFEVYEGKGGHVKGEAIYIERKEKIAFTGDIFVNIKGFTKEQARFNRLAPYLMTSVDTDPDMAKSERDAFWTLLDKGKWQIFGGHGSVLEIEI